MSKRKNVPLKEFVKVFNSSNSFVEVATRLDLKLESVRIRSSVLKRDGYPLKSFPRKKVDRKESVEEITRFLEAEGLLPKPETVEV